MKDDRRSGSANTELKRLTGRVQLVLLNIKDQNERREKIISLLTGGNADPRCIDAVTEKLGKTRVRDGKFLKGTLWATAAIGIITVAVYLKVGDISVFLPLLAIAIAYYYGKQAKTTLDRRYDELPGIFRIYLERINRE
ncbi:MAG: hypothetical protein LIO85_05320 [Rikenellaceae bacterium]|nr:hypothetical protein [Rikenellaceae bacterium]